MRSSRPPRSYQFSGYEGNSEVLSPNGEIQSNFWQSGAEVELENVRAQE